MAKKSRTPAPPRRPVQAPKRRVAPSAPADDRRKLLLLVAFAGAGIVALIVVIGVLVFAGNSGGPTGGGDSSVAAKMRAAGCTYRDTPGIKALPNHANVPSPTMKAVYGDGKGVVNGVIHYWSYPPANGPHYGIPATWLFYDEPVPPVQVVHNEEHGGVVVWWGPKVPASTVEKIRAWYQTSALSMVGTPAPKLGNKVAITAWTGNPQHYFVNGDYGTGHVATCPSFEEKAFTAFRDAYRGKGPEGIPMSVNQPGT